ncbi:MAG TPA: cytochrome c [Noviherbaspirillum sp.]|nr:cytochrome c [Noviherbaspirillum sp.]
MKRILLLVIGIILLVPAAIVGYEWVHEPGSEETSMPVTDQPAQIARGEYLAKAGNCMACHTTRGGQAYAGGRAIDTPFGVIYSSNLTSDVETGIGRWSADDFWRALHNGKSRDGSFLYPAFPYPDYTKVTRVDADALFAYINTVPPARQPNRPNELRFPYNQRILLAFWRWLYFTPGTYQPQAEQTAEWNRGAYLVQGLGHCSACHTSRTSLGGATDKELAGGLIPQLGWYAASLSADAGTGLGEWEKEEIAALLKTGVSTRGAVFGPMGEVVSGSLQHLAGEDIAAMATYLKSFPATGASRRSEPAIESAETEAMLRQGAKLYETHCVECHRADGKGIPPSYPPLAGNRSLAANPALNPIRMVLNGGYPPSTAGNPRPYGMPPFSAILNDSEVAAVVSYIRMSWGNQGTLVAPMDVARHRGAPIE